MSDYTTLDDLGVRTSSAADNAAQDAYNSLAPLAREFGITDLSGIKSVEDIFRQWLNNTREVSLYTLIGISVNGFSMTPSDIGKNLAREGLRKVELVKDALVEASMVFADSFANDPELQKALANTEIFQKTIVPVVQTVSSVMEATEKFVNGPWGRAIPYLELILRAVRIWWFPTEGLGFTKDSAKLARKEVSKITRLLAADLKKEMSKIMIPVPEVLLGLANDALDPSFSLDKLIEDSFQEAGVDPLELNWLDSNGNLNIGNVIETFFTQEDQQRMLNSLPSWAQKSVSLISQVYEEVGIDIVNWISNYYVHLYNAQMNSIVSHPPISDFNVRFLNNNLITLYSSEILDIYEEISNQAFSDTMMIRLACDKLKEDGAIVDYNSLDYDEYRTEEGGSNFRKAFFEVNNLINSYHDLLNVLTGQRRFNLTESIPLIDFYQNTFSLKESYVQGSSHTEVLTIEDNFTNFYSINTGATDPLSTRTTDFYEKSDDSFSPGIVNLGASQGSTLEKIFYHPEYLNVVVDVNYSSVETSTGVWNDRLSAPSFLVGKFCKPAEADYRGNTKYWTLVDESTYALSYDPPEFPKGFLYNHYHLSSGYYVDRPLYDAGTSGIATRVWTTVNGLLGGFKSDATDPNYNRLTSTFSLKGVSYYGEKSTNRFEVIKNLSTTIAEWNNHISSGVFTINGGNDINHTKTLSYAKMRGDYKTSKLREFNNLARYTQEIETFIRESNTSLASNSVCSAFSAILSKVDIAKVVYVELRTPLDLLRESYVASRYARGLSAPANTAEIYLFSESKFNRPWFTRSIRKKFDPIKSFFKWVARKSTYKTITTLVEDLTKELEYKNPTFYLISNSDLGYSASPSAGEEYRKYAFIFDNNQNSNYNRFMRSWGNTRGISAETFIGFEVMSADHYIPPTSVKVNLGSYGILDYEGVVRGGSECYVYKLKSISINVSSIADLLGTTFSFSPFSYAPEASGRGNKFVRRGLDGKITSYRWEAFKSLEGGYITRGLPPEKNSSYDGVDICPVSFFHFNLSILTKAIGSSFLTSVVREAIEDRPLIQVDETDSTPLLTLKESKKFFQLMKDNAHIIENLPEEIFNIPVYDVSGEGEILTTETISRTGLLRTIKGGDGFTSRYDKYVEVLKLLDDNLISEEDAKQLDEQFGTNAFSWMEDDPLSDYYIDERIFGIIVKYIVQRLEGSSGGLPVRRIADEDPVGNLDSLYYKRYNILNQRLNKYTGALYHVANLEKSLSTLSNGASSLREKLFYFQELLDIIPVENYRQLVYIGNKFIDAFKYDTLRKHAGDVCLLTCGACSVKHICPYYDEREVILTMLNEEEDFVFYFKDNMLNQVESIKENGTSIIDGFLEVHNPYSEIVQDDEPVRLIDDVIEKIVSIDPNFKLESEESTDVYYDAMGWLTKGRYGTVDIVDKENPVNNKYLYDVFFIGDTESYFEYSSGDEFSITYQGKSYVVRMKEATDFTENIKSNDDLFLVSDDGYDPIYIGRAKNISRYIHNPQNSEEVAYAHVAMLNIEDPNQYWKESFEYRGATYPGRLRKLDRSDLIGDGSYKIEEVLKGKLPIRNYYNFLREVRIPIKDFLWTLEGDAQSVEEAKRSLQFFKTRVRLVAVRPNSVYM